jgi:hypothetical protein
MTRAEEWDWPPTRRRRYYRIVDINPPISSYDAVNSCGWNSPVTKKVVSVYWLTMITCLKVILISALTIMAFGASWLICTVLTL